MRFFLQNKSYLHTQQRNFFCICNAQFNLIKLSLQQFLRNKDVL